MGKRDLTRWARLAGIPALLCALTLLTACQSRVYKAYYTLGVTEAVIEESVSGAGPDAQEIAVRVSWSADSDGLIANISNPADSTAAIVWDGATVSFDGGPPEALLSSAPHPDPELPQPPTAIPRYGQSIIEMLPAAAAEWEWFADRAMGGSWHPKSALFGVSLEAEQTDADRLALARTAVGRKMIVRLPVRVGSRRLTHIYDMRVIEADVRAAYR
jgi:hypothetical protein